jgi:hypothetical protein
VDVLELLRALDSVSTAALIAAVAFYAWRSRDGADQRSDDLAKSLVALVADLSSNVKASTQAITALNECETDTQSALLGMRREVQIAHGGQAEKLDAIFAKIELVPVEVKSVLAEDFERVGTALSSLRLQNDMQSRQLDSALEDWAKTGAKLAGMIRSEDSKSEQEKEPRPPEAAEKNEDETATHEKEVK